MIEYLARMFIVFLICSFLGWCMEVICGFNDLKRFVNRGFLIGPICPIYGVGALSFFTILGGFRDEPFVLAFLVMLIAGSLEYLTSYIMEKIFSVRWWDYSNSNFHINGRVCAEALGLFGILGVLAVRDVIPFILSLLNRVSNSYILIISSILILLFLTDICVSTFIIFKCNKRKDNKKNEDFTEEMSLYVKGTLRNMIVIDFTDFNVPKFFKTKKVHDK